MNKTLQSLSLQVSKHLRCFRLFLLTLLLCGFMQAMAETWTDKNGIIWSFTVNGTEATDIRVSGSENTEKIYIYGDPNRSDKETQLPFQPGAWDAAAMRFSYTDGAHLPTIFDAVYFNLKSLIFDVADVTEDFDLKVMNGWWSNTYYDHVKWQDGLNELQITPTMAEECAKGGGGRDLDLMLYSGSMTLNAVYYESISIPEEVVIPEKVYVGSTELTVTGIGYGAFCGYDLTSIEIPSGVTTIGNRAFQYCTRLKNVNIPSGVTYIGEAAFYDCFSLTSVNIPSSVLFIANRAFYGCGDLTSITVDSGNMIYDSRDNCNAIIETASNTLIAGCNTTVIPNGVTVIGDNAFNNCTGLTSIEIPNSVTSIRDQAFYGCSGLTSIEIPNSVTTIGNRAFFDCRNLTSITIPNSVTSIYGYAFHYTGWYENQSDGILYLDNWLLGYKGNGPTGDLVINEGTKGIAVSSFSYCSDLTSVTIPNSVTSISDWAFESCYGLTSVTIPSSVTSIGEWAFYSCYALTSVTIPGSVTSIGDFAFYYCSNLTELFCYAKTPPACGDYTFEEISKSCTLYVPEYSFETYKATEPWSSFTKIVAVITPISENEDISFADEITEGTDLSNAVIDNTYFNMNSENGDGYNATEQALVLNSTTTEEQMNAIQDAEAGTTVVQENYRGVIFEIAAGQGTVTVDTKTIGTHILNVQIGKNEPTKITKSERGTVDIPYDVTEPTYVYLYASTGGGSAARLDRASSAGGNSVLLYGYKVNVGATGIVKLKNSKVEGLKYYDLNGRQVKTPGKGVYILNGKKVLLK